MVYDKFCFWKDAFEKYGLEPETAENEACKVEHALSDDAFFADQACDTDGKCLIPSVDYGPKM